jgi:hypothetical protein
MPEGKECRTAMVLHPGTDKGRRTMHGHLDLLVGPASARLARHGKGTSIAIPARSARGGAGSPAGGPCGINDRPLSRCKLSGRCALGAGIGSFKPRPLRARAVCGGEAFDIDRPGGTIVVRFAFPKLPKRVLSSRYPEPKRQSAHTEPLADHRQPGPCRGLARLRKAPQPAGMHGFDAGRTAVSSTTAPTVLRASAFPIFRRCYFSMGGKGPA